MHFYFLLYKQKRSSLKGSVQCSWPTFYIFIPFSRIIKTQLHQDWNDSLDNSLIMTISSRKTCGCCEMRIFLFFPVIGQFLQNNDNALSVIILVGLLELVNNVDGYKFCSFKYMVLSDQHSTYRGLLPSVMRVKILLSTFFFITCYAYKIYNI